MADVSISEYVRKRRLTLAAQELLNTDSTVLDVAINFVNHILRLAVHFENIMELLLHKPRIIQVPKRNLLYS